MKTFAWALVGVLAVSPAFLGCEKPDENQMRASEERSSANIEHLIKARLDADEQLSAAHLSVDVDEQAKRATLSGTVPSESLRAKALELARSAQTDLTIDDRITVRPTDVSRQEFTEEMAKEEWRKAKEFGEKVGNRLEDAWIHSKIVAQLIASTKTQERTIDVDVVNSNVTLRGKVKDRAQKSEAERLARATEGVKRVDNQIDVAA